MIDDKFLCELWIEFSDIPLKENSDDIDQDFYIWESGCCRFDIWLWFDRKHSVGLYKIIEDCSN